MGDFLAFRKMITPIFIQIIFWVGVVCIVIGSIIIMASPTVSYYGYNSGGGNVIGGLISLIFGPLFWRVFCETLILFFRINDTLTDIKNLTARQVPGAYPPAGYAAPQYPQYPQYPQQPPAAH